MQVATDGSLRFRQYPRYATFGAIIVFVAACAADPARKFDTEAHAIGLEPGALTGAGYRHRTWSNGHGKSDRLHIYLDGDGRPFIGRRHVAADPTPRDPLVLRMLEQDPAPALMIGRPCYHAMGDSCTPDLWTSARYGEAVVASMIAATRTIIKERAPTTVVLIGYSGGGSLAVLMAGRMPEVDALITVAANLDIEAWTELHGYSPLVRSLNPLLQPSLDHARVQLHFTGGKDGNVPPSIHNSARKHFPNARFSVIDQYDHRCCWIDTWPQRLAELDSALAATGAEPPAGG